VRNAGLILLESAPNGVSMCDVKHDLEKVTLLLDYTILAIHVNTNNSQIKGVTSIHELHIWRLNQQKTLASVHVVVSEDSVEDFMKIAKVINECFHAYGIHSVTLQPELSDDGADADAAQDSDKLPRCQVICGTLCEQFTCCG
jgi:zinc transporter 1